MGVYIKGMEMPTSCPCELLGIGYDLYCSFASGIPARVREYYECCQNGTRPSWCPLIEIPPHGRLIDADALSEKMVICSKHIPKDSFEWDLCGEVITQLALAPTIIETDLEEEETK